jgi:tetratricopeptide (TPR) repeat protein
VRELYYCELLHALTHLQDRAAVMALADDMRHRWPDSPFVAFWVGFAFENIDPRRAIPELERAVAGIPDLPQPQVRLAMSHENARHWQRALELHERVLRTWPNEIRSRSGRARCFAKMGQAEAAVAQFEAILAEGSATYWLHAGYGEALRALGRNDAALLAFDCASGLGPAAALPWNARAELLLAMGRAAEALTAAERACELEPGNTRAQSIRGVALLHADRPQDAVVALEQVVGDWPWSDQSWRALAQARWRAGNPGSARQAIDRALAIAAEDPRNLAELGKIELAAGDRPAAMATFRRVLAIVPDDYEAAVNLAGLCWEQGERDESVRLLAVARAANPAMPHAWAPSIQFLETMERWRDAVAVRTEFCVARPQDRAARVQLVEKVLALPAEPGDAELLTRTFAELEALDGGSRDDVAALRLRAADRVAGR